MFIISLLKQKLIDYLLHVSIKEFISKRLLIVNQILLSSQENAMYFSHDKLFLIISIIIHSLIQ